MLSFFAGMAVGWLLLPRSLPKRKPAATLNENGAWEFPMDTLPQMIAIPAERRERFLAELPSMFRRMWELDDRFPLEYPPGTVWVDDDLGEFRPTLIDAPEGVGDAFASRPLDAGA